MKFVHIADMHFDSPFATLSDKGNLGEQRRLEQRKIFKKIIEYIKENKIEYLLIYFKKYFYLYIIIFYLKLSFFYNTFIIAIIKFKYFICT